MISLTLTRDAVTVPDLGLAIIIIGTVTLALVVNVAAALEWMRNRR